MAIPVVAAEVNCMKAKPNAKIPDLLHGGFKPAGKPDLEVTLT